MVSFGFPPLISGPARTLVLGTLPSRISLSRSEYYANPRNQFWMIMEAATGVELPSNYSGRVALLADHKVAIWDVLAAATRSGSMDSDISDDAIPNNFSALFHAYPSIHLIGFNGETAAALYRRRVLPQLSEEHRSIEQVTVPSTSPAHAAMSLQTKIQRGSVVWRPDSAMTLYINPR